MNLQPNLYWNVKTTGTITDENANVCSIEQARRFWQAGKCYDCNEAFVVLAEHDFDMVAARAALNLN